MNINSNRQELAITPVERAEDLPRRAVCDEAGSLRPCAGSSSQAMISDRKSSGMSKGYIVRFTEEGCKLFSCNGVFKGENDQKRFVPEWWMDREPAPGYYHFKNKNAFCNGFFEESELEEAFVLGKAYEFKYKQYQMRKLEAELMKIELSECPSIKDCIFTEVDDLGDVF